MNNLDNLLSCSIHIEHDKSNNRFRVKFLTSNIDKPLGFCDIREKYFPLDTFKEGIMLDLSDTLIEFEKMFKEVYLKTKENNR